MLLARQEVSMQVEELADRVVAVGVWLLRFSTAVSVAVVLGTVAEGVWRQEHLARLALPALFLVAGEVVAYVWRRDRKL